MNNQINIPHFCTKCLEKHNLKNFSIQLGNANQQSDRIPKVKRTKQIDFPICNSCKTKMKNHIRKYSVAGFIIFSLIALSILLVAINQYRLNPPTGLLELEPTILGAIVILVYVGILVMPTICLYGIIKPEAFLKYPVKLEKQNSKDLDLLHQNNSNSIVKMFSFKNRDYGKLFEDANRNAIKIQL